MGPLVQTILAVGVLGAVESGLEPDFDLPWALPLLLLTPYLAARALRRAGLAGRFRLERRLARVQLLSPLFVHALALTPCGWRRTVSRWTGGEVSFYEWPGPALLLLFLPFALATLASIDARARLRPPGSRLRGSMRALELRMFVTATATLAAFVLASAAVGSSQWLRVQIEEVSAWSAAFTGLLLLVMIACLPPFLRLVFDNEPLPAGPLRSLLDAVARQADFRCRELVVWRTGSLVPNAAILGLWPRQRLVVFSDALLAQLSPGQLAAVYAHEIGHAKRRHVPIFLAWTGAFFLGADLLSRALDPSGGALALVVLAATLVVWLLSFVQLSRRFELEADLYAIELLGEGESLARALEAVGGELRDVASLRHFSPSVRAAFLRRAELEPAFARAFRRRLRIWSGLAVALFATVGALQVRELVRDYGSERAVAEQRLGQREEALARAGRLLRDGDAAGLAALSQRAQAEAAYELGQDRPAEAADWLRLAAAGGDEAAAQVARALALVEAGELEAARTMLEAAQPDWWRRIAAWTARAQ